jgi:hypothetical protein
MKFLEELSEEERSSYLGLNSPYQIQQFLDNLPYIGEKLNRPPLRVLRDRQCHCQDGAIFAALALRNLGFPSILVDLVPDPDLDEDHTLAIYKVNKKYGAIAKSNFVGLRFREPVYHSLRELAMSYFEVFYNINGEKTLRGYTLPLNLSIFDRYEWATQQGGIDRIVDRFCKRKSLPLIDESIIPVLSRVDRRSYEAGMLGSDFDGLYKPAVGL